MCHMTRRDQVTEIKMELKDKMGDWTVELSEKRSETHRHILVNEPEKGYCAKFMKEILFCLRSEETQLSWRATAGISHLPPSYGAFL